MSDFVLGDEANDSAKSLAKRLDLYHICRPERPEFRRPVICVLPLLILPMTSL